MEFRIVARGHENIRSTHQSTWQLTKEDWLTPRGDCIVGINASHAAIDTPAWLKEHLQEEGEINIVINCDDKKITGTAKGHKDLRFKDKQDMVFRRSTYTCDRTMAIECDFAAKELPESIVKQLKDGQEIIVTISKK